MGENEEYLAPISKSNIGSYITWYRLGNRMPSSGAEKPQGRTNGVLPISVTQQGDKSGKGSRGKAKISQDGVKMSIRYLPPGMKEFECTNILGDAWRVGGGQVDWFSFAPGKQART